MSVAFWSVKLTNKQPVEVQPPEGYVLNVQNAAIVGEGSVVVKVNTTSVEGDKIDAVICTLRSKTTDQVSMSLVFGYDVPVSFVAEGKGEVHLSGYYQPGPEDDDEENDYDSFGEEGDEEEDSEDEESDDEDDIKGAEAAIAKLGAARKLKNTEEDSEDDSEDEEDDEEDSEEDDEVDEAFIAKMVARNNLAAPKSSRVEELDASEEDSEEGSEEEEDSEEEAPPVKVQKTQPKGVVTQQKQQQNNNKPQTPNNKNNNNNNNKPKTPQTNNKTPNQKQQQNSGFKSGDKRKR